MIAQFWTITDDNAGSGLFSARIYIPHFVQDINGIGMNLRSCNSSYDLRVSWVR